MSISGTLKKLELDIVTVRNVGYKLERPWPNGVSLKIFLITFALFSSLVILLHASVYLIFHRPISVSARQTILKKSQGLAKVPGSGRRDHWVGHRPFIPRPSNDIKVSIKRKAKTKYHRGKRDDLWTLTARIIPWSLKAIRAKERALTLQFLATVDSQKEGAGHQSRAFFPIVSCFLCSVADCLLSLCPPDLPTDPWNQADDQADETAGSDSQSPHPLAG